MTVEELNIKITADASGFKNEIAAVNKQLDALRANAANAGSAVTAAFGGLIGTEVSAARAEGERGGNAAVTYDVLKGRQDNVTAADDRSSVISRFADSAWNRGSAVMPDFTAYYAENAGVVNVPKLDKGETVIGAVGGSGAQSSQPINITTTVELDGDKVGESVNSYFMRRNRITNGIED